MGKRFRNWVQKVREKAQNSEKWQNFKSVFKGTLKEFGRQQLNKVVDNILEDPTMQNSAAGYAIKMGKELVNSKLMGENKARYSAIKDISEKAISSWQFRGKINDVLTKNINKLISNEQFKIKPKKNTDGGIVEQESTTLPEKGIQRKYFIEGLQQDPDYVKKLFSKLRQIYDDVKTPEKIKQKVFDISKALINFQQETKEQEKATGTQDVILFSEKQDPIQDQADTGTDTVNEINTVTMSFSNIVKDAIYKQFVKQKIQESNLNGAQKAYAKVVCLTSDGLILNCEKSKQHQDMEAEKIIYESILKSAPKPQIEFSLLNYKKQYLSLNDVLTSVSKNIKDISKMSGEIDVNLPVKSQKKIQKKNSEIPRQKNETSEVTFKASNVSAFRTREI